MARTAATQVRVLHAEVAKLKRAVASLLAVAKKAGSTNGAAAPKRTLKLSPARQAALKRQGVYLGYMRQLNPTQKAQVKKLKEAKGIIVAAAEARRMAKG